MYFVYNLSQTFFLLAIFIFFLFFVYIITTLQWLPNHSLRENITWHVTDVNQSELVKVGPESILIYREVINHLAIVTECWTKNPRDKSPLYKSSVKFLLLYNNYLYKIVPTPTLTIRGKEQKSVSQYQPRDHSIIT